MTHPPLRIRHAALPFISFLLASTLVASGCSLVSGGEDDAAADDCSTGELRCTCYANDTCDPGLSCLSGVCVLADGTATGSGGTGTTPSTGTQTGSGATGATSSATGAGGSGTTSSGNTGSTTSTAAGGSTAIDSPIIDAFASCDTSIENYSGRSGTWYFFADTAYNATFNVGSPGTAWADTSCGAWLILGCTASSACTYAGLGFELASGNPYNLSSYSGVSVEFEGGDDVYFVVKTSNGGYFGTWLAGTTGNQTRNADFSSLAVMANSAVSTLDKSLITEMQFTVGTSLGLSAGWGLAVHQVSLY